MKNFFRFTRRAGLRHRLTAPSLAFALALASSAGFASPKKSTPIITSIPRLSTKPSTVTAYEKSILGLINQHRKSKGLKSLQVDPYIQKLAARHSAAMAGQDSLTHGGFTHRAGLIQDKLGVKVVAENIACKQTSAKDVATAWIKSPPHRQNLEGRYELTGLSAAKDRHGQWYYTQIFASPAASGPGQGRTIKPKR